MRILITNDDGKDAFGLTLLIEAAQRRFRESKIVVVTSEARQMGLGMALRGDKNWELKEIAPDRYLSTGYPADVIYAAFCEPQRFLPAGSFDLVLTGVNEGANVGLDVLHSGTVAPAIMASAIFGCTAYAFSQQIIQGKEGEVKQGSGEEKGLYNTASIHLQPFLNDLQLDSGLCFNVNFPLAAPKGVVSVKSAPYSRWRSIPTGVAMSQVERLNYDMERLGQGYITIAEVQLQVNPSLRY